MFLAELRDPVSSVKGVGSRTAEALQRLSITTVFDLLTHYPRDYEDRSRFHTLAEAAALPHAAVKGTVIAHDYIHTKKGRTLKVWFDSDGTRGVLLCFGRNFLQNTLSVGKELYIWGQFKYRFGEIQTSAFEVEPVTASSPRLFGRILPVYSLTEGLGQTLLRKIIFATLHSYLPTLDEELPEHLMKKYRLVSKADALRGIHFPESREQIDLGRKTLVYEELFYFQVRAQREIALRKQGTRIKTELPRSLQQDVVRSLPYTLTPDQEKTIGETTADMESDTPMTRLIQGDTGSGKTLTAFLAAIPVIQNGGQAAFMAPTELLALQHSENAAKLLEPHGIRIAYLSGTVSGENRISLLKALANGEIDLLLGTHALFSDEVVFRNLKLVIIDEQHRFGVLQRISLVEKGNNPDVLLMTATPIPRSLALTVYGDLSVSTIRTMPPGRIPIITHLAVQGKEQKVYDFVRDELNTGRQAYFVYPLIEQSDKIDLKDAEGMRAYLAEHIFPEFSIGLIHSRMKDDEKRKEMEKFISGETRILTATSVVEVGVDVPNAVCMVIEHAERFGLAALHQLRGRVGRSEYQSYAFLVYSRELNDVAKKRMMIMKENNDGFVIAEEDLKLRGPGDLTGKMQSGYIPFTIANVQTDLELLKQAKTDALEIISDDAGLLKIEHGVIRKIVSITKQFENIPGI